MEPSVVEGARRQLVERRARIQDALKVAGEARDLVRLLREVDEALARANGTHFGTCLACHESVDDGFLLANPAIQYCLCALSEGQQRALERDLGLASRIQWSLLPRQDLAAAGWETHFRYLPAGPVSGDTCDLVAGPRSPGELYFLAGDVSGKGVAAAFQMARLNALFRTLIDEGQQVREIVERANAFFAEGAPASHFVTLVCGRADASGGVELCNAGHCPPLVLHGKEVRKVGSSGLPIGITGGFRYGSELLRLAPADTVLLYTDGITEAADPEGNDYGDDRLSSLFRDRGALPLARLAAEILEDLGSFQKGSERTDDQTILLLRRSA